MKKKLLKIILALFFSIFVNLSYSQGKIRAIIMGVSKYKNLPKEEQLNYADNDAISFFKYLKKLPNADTSNIFLYTNERAISTTIMLKIKYIIDKNTEEDIFIIYFSGHGEAQNNESLGHFLLYNSVRNTDIHAAFSNGIKLNELNKYLEYATSNNKKIFLIADACHAGKALKNGNVNGVLQSLKNELSSTLKLVSCNVNEAAYEGNIWGGGHGMFTFHLLNGALGNADLNTDNKISFGELSKYIALQSNKDNSSLGLTQTPQFTGDSSALLFNILPHFTKDTLTRDSLIQENSENKTQKKYEHKYNTERQVLVDSFNFLLEKKQFIDPVYYTNDFDDTFVFEKLTMKNIYNKNVIFSSDLKEIYALDSEKKIVSEYSVDSLKILKKLKKQKTEITALALSPDNLILVTADNSNKMFVWNLLEEKVQKKIKKAHEYYAEKIKFSHNGKYLVSTNKKELFIRSTDSYEIIAKKIFKRNNIRDFIFSKDDKFIFIVGTDKLIHIYSIDNLKMLKKIEGNNKSIDGIKFSNNGLYFYTYSHKGDFNAWDINTYEQIFQAKVKAKSKIEVLNKYLIYLDKGELKAYNFVDKKKVNLTGIPNNFTNFHIQNNKIVLFSKYKIIIADFLSPKLNPSTYFILKELKLKGMKGLKLNDLKISLFVAISLEVDKVVMSLINRDNTVIKEDEIDLTIKRLEVLLEIFPKYIFLAKKAKTSILLLEAYKIINTNNTELYETALAKLQKITKLDSFVTYPYNAMSEIYLKQRKPKLADSVLNIAMKKNPNWTEPQYYNSEKYLLQKKYTEALTQYKKIIATQPNITLSYNNIGKIYTNIGSYKEADKFFTLSLKIDSLNAETFSLFAKLQEKRGRYIEALDLLSEALKIDSANYDANKNSANLFLFLYTKINKNKNYLLQALNHFENAKKHNPYKAESYTNLSDLYIKLLEYDTDESSEFLANNCFANLTNSNYSSIKIQAFNKIEDYCKKALELNPFSVPAYTGLEYVDSFGNGNQNTFNYYQKAIDIDKTNPSAYYSYAAYYVKKQKFTSAIKYFKLAIKADKKFLPAYTGLWDVYAELNNYYALDSLFLTTSKIFKNSPVFFHKNAARKDKQNTKLLKKALEKDSKYLLAKITEENINFSKNRKTKKLSGEIVEYTNFSFNRKKTKYKYIEVERKGKKGIMGLDGNLIVPFNYSSIIAIDEKTICAIKTDTILELQILHWYNTLGDVFSAIKCNDYSYDKDCFVVQNQQYRYGCFDKYSKPILPFIYDGIYPFTVKNKLIKVQQGEFYGCYNRNGEKIIKIEYNNIEPWTHNKIIEGCKCRDLNEELKFFLNTGQAVEKP